MNQIPDWMREPAPTYDPAYFNEAHEDEAEAYVRAHIADMHDDFDIAPYVIRMLDVWDDTETDWRDKRTLMAAIAMEIKDAHIAVALDVIRRKQA